jgi:hypothetical protein
MTGRTATASVAAAETPAACAGSGQRMDLHSDAAGTDLLPAATDLRGIEPHCQRSSPPRSVASPTSRCWACNRLSINVFVCPRSSPPHQGLESGANLRTDVAGAHRQPEHLADHVGHSEARPVIDLSKRSGDPPPWQRRLVRSMPSVAHVDDWADGADPPNYRSTARGL